MDAPLTITVQLRGHIDRADVPGLCRRICDTLELTRARIAFCEVSGVEVDVVIVDALARLQLAARRRGCQVRLLNASLELRELVGLMGLGDVLTD